MLLPIPFPPSTIMQAAAVAFWPSPSYGVVQNSTLRFSKRRRTLPTFPGHRSRRAAVSYWFFFLVTFAIQIEGFSTLREARGVVVRVFFMQFIMLLRGYVCFFVLDTSNQTCNFFLVSFPSVQYSFLVNTHQICSGSSVSLRRCCLFACIRSCSAAVYSVMSS